MENPLNAMEETVDTTQQEMGLDDAALNVSEQPEGATLESVLGQQEAPKGDTANTEQPPKGQEKQAGWIQTRIEEGVQKQLGKALAAERARIAAEYDAKLQAELRPMREAMLNREADELVASGKVTSREIALEYLRLKNGAPAMPETPAPPARDEKGQFTKQPTTTPPDDTEAYGRKLIAQAETIESATGINVMEAYNTDPEVKRRVLSREWDFTDVAKHMSGGKQPANALPTPTRKPNGSGLPTRSISDLSSEQFKKVNEFLARGGVIDLRK